jgi:hypothetical protein
LKSDFPEYKPNWFFKNRHINTIWANKIRLIAKPKYERFRIITPDADFLDIDTLINNNQKAVVLLHGLEGNSESAYIKSIAPLLHNKGYDVFVLNLRGCSGVPNLVQTSYNSGRTEDLQTVINHITINCNYDKIDLIGYSLGGNLVLKYLGENQDNPISKAVAVSVPCDLKASSLQLQKGFFNKVYSKIFVRKLKQKLKTKAKQFPELKITNQQITAIKTVYDFDELYTAPVHGYKNASDYYNQCSSKHFIKNIRTPTLLINALDDSFLTPECFPFEEAKANPNFTLLTPKHGGHVGFMGGLINKVLWEEEVIYLVLALV